MKESIETCAVLFRGQKRKKKVLLVVGSALHLGRTTKFRGLQGIQLIGHPGTCYRLQESKVEFPVEVIIISALHTLCRFTQGPKQNA